MERRPKLWLTPLHRAELAHAVARHLFHREFSSQEAARVHAEFAADRTSGRWTESAFPEVAYEAAIQLADKLGPRFSTKTLDTLHVACALELGAGEFWTFDEHQAKLAKAAGLIVT